MPITTAPAGALEDGLLLDVVELPPELPQAATTKATPVTATNVRARVDGDGRLDTGESGTWSIQFSYKKNSIDHPSVEARFLPVSSAPAGTWTIQFSYRKNSVDHVYGGRAELHRLVLIVAVGRSCDKCPEARSRGEGVVPIGVDVRMVKRGERVGRIDLEFEDLL